MIAGVNVGSRHRDGRLRWLMLAGPFVGGSMGYVFYAAQPYLLELYGADPAKVCVVTPGVDLHTFTPGDRSAARRDRSGRRSH